MPDEAAEDVAEVDIREPVVRRGWDWIKSSGERKEHGESSGG